jgi:hypothetical protein
MPGNLRLETGDKWIKIEKRKINAEAKKFENALEKIWDL